MGLSAPYMRLRGLKRWRLRSEVSRKPPVLPDRRQTTKFNGASYISQRAAAAVYTPEGLEDVKRNTDYYMRNAEIIRDTFRKIGFRAYGGENSPYVWATSGDGRDSWELFTFFLENFGFSTTPGSGFGSKGEGYVRLTGFNSRENTEKGMSRLLERMK